jgi:hypothetical protein
MTRPKWTKSFLFHLDWGTGMPIKALTLWETNLRFLEELLKAHKLDLVQVFIHWHKDPDEIHYCGVTWMDERRMAFCAGNDKETMLHEVAHLMMMYPEHDELWADQLLVLHKQHLKANELKKADAELCRDYTAAAKAYKKRYKKDPPKRVKKHPRNTVETDTQIKDLPLES